MKSSRWNEAVGLPDAALEQHLAILGKTGSGKTYTAKGLVEQLVGEGRRVCIVDPTGAWYGLRSRWDGGPGLPVCILGGRHGDVGLPSLAGEACARLVAEGKTPHIIFDTSELTVGERTKWFIDFAGTLFRANHQALHVVLDEAHVFAPQGKVPDPETGKMLHAANTLASGGRSRGIRLVMISQRPAKLHKDSLTCADSLIAMRMIAPQDREAVEDWILGCGDKTTGKRVLDSLAQLARGEGWVWYPEGGVLGRVTFPPIKTFDSSRTPEHGEAVAPPPDLGSIDLSSITTALEAAAKAAAESDPKSLRARVAELAKKNEELREQLAGAMRAPIASVDNRVGELERQILERDRTIAAIGTTIQQLEDGIRVEVSEAIEVFNSEIRRLLAGQPLAHVRRAEQSNRDLDIVEGHAAVAAEVDARLNGKVVPSGQHAAAPEGIGQPHRRILNAIVWWQTVGVMAPSRVQVAVVAGYTAQGGTFNRYVSTLKGHGLVETGDGSIDITAGGAQLAEIPAGAPTRAKLHDMARGILDAPHRKILDVLLAAGGSELGRTEVAEKAGYEASGGTFNRYMSHLSSLKLIRYPRRTTIAAAEWLFPEGLR